MALESVWETVRSFLKKFPLLLAGLVILALMGGGIGVAVFLRWVGLDMGGVAIPSFIVMAIFCVIAYQFSSNFFPEEEKAPASETTEDGLPSSRKKSRA